MSVAEHRSGLFELLPENSMVISYAGVPIHTNEDDYYNFEVNSQFFYLTGLEREKMALLMVKCGELRAETLFIEAADPLAERWTGKMPTKEEAGKISGISDVRFVDALGSAIGRYMSRMHIEHVFFDVFRCGDDDLPDYNAVKAKKFARKYPGVKLRDLHEICVPLREIKDEDEIELVRQAVDITRRGLEHVLKTLKPGMFEYQAQADFEYTCRSLGATRFAFNTISGAGLNGCMMHYVTNQSI